MAVLNIGDLLSGQPVTVAPGTKINVLKRLMLEHGVKHVPIVNDSEVVGLVTDRDIKLAQSVSSDPAFHDHATVEKVQVDDPYIVDVTAPAVEVLGVMVERNIGSAIVTDGGRLCGMFTRGDACRALQQILAARTE